MSPEKYFTKKRGQTWLLKQWTVPLRGKDELQGVPVSELIYIHSKLIIVDDNRNSHISEEKKIIRIIESLPLIKKNNISCLFDIPIKNKQCSFFDDLLQ